MTIIPSNSFADFKWVKLADLDNFTFYEDYYNSRVMGESITFWVMKDYFDPQGYASGEYTSSVLLQILDCTELSLTSQLIEYFSGPMGTGKLVRIEKFNESKREDIKRFITHNSVDHREYNNICTNTFNKGLGPFQDYWLELYEATAQK